MTFYPWEVASYVVAGALSGGLVGYILGRLKTEEWKAKARRVSIRRVRGGA